MKHKVFFTSVLSMAFSLVLASSAIAEEQKKVIDGNELVNGAISTLEEFVADKGMEQFRENLKKAHGVMIVPKWTRAGLVVGGSGGNGVVLIRKNGEWRGPAFYEYGGGSVGAQIGISVQRIVMLIMQERAIEKLLAGKVKLGAGFSAAAGTVGVAQETGTTKVSSEENVDILSYAKAKGLYAGMVAEGSTMSPLHETSKAYYGQEAKVQDILIAGSIKSDKAQPLRDLLSKNSQ